MKQLIFSLSKNIKQLKLVSTADYLLIENNKISLKNNEGWKIYVTSKREAAEELIKEVWHDLIDLGNDFLVNTNPEKIYSESITNKNFGVIITLKINRVDNFMESCELLKEKTKDFSGVLIRNAYSFKESSSIYFRYGSINNFYIQGLLGSPQPAIINSNNRLILDDYNINGIIPDWIPSPYEGTYKNTELLLTGAKIVYQQPDKKVFINKHPNGERSFIHEQIIYKKLHLTKHLLEKYKLIESELFPSVDRKCTNLAFYTIRSGGDEFPLVNLERVRKKYGKNFSSIEVISLIQQFVGILKVINENGFYIEKLKENSIWINKHYQITYFDISFYDLKYDAHNAFLLQNKAVKSFAFKLITSVDLDLIIRENVDRIISSYLTNNIELQKLNVLLESNGLNFNNDKHLQLIDGVYNSELFYEIDELVDGYVLKLHEKLDVNRSLWCWPELANVEIPQLTFAEGVAGVINLLIDAYKYKKNDIQKENILKVCTWLYQEYSHWRDLFQPGLYYGTSGIASVFLKVSEIEGNPTYIEFAKEIMNSINLEGICNCDYTDGLAGIGSVNNSLYRKTGEIIYMEKSIYIAHLIIEKANLSDQSISWECIDKNQYLGFAHGIAGIGSFLIDIYLISNDKSIIETIEIIYMTLMNTRIENDTHIYWPKTIDGKEKVYYWCHGTCGISLFLINFYKICPSQELKNILLKISYTLSQEINSPLIHCHGVSSALEVILKIEVILKKNLTKEKQLLLQNILLRKTKNPNGYFSFFNEANESILSYSTGEVGVYTSLVAYLLSKSGGS
ncbi:lanthionine synthetase LanC family protein [Sutcliffiella cohnii]